jgi:hypothetical protein
MTQTHDLENDTSIITALSCIGEQDPMVCIWVHHRQLPILSKGNNFKLPSIYLVIQAVVNFMVIGAAIHLFIMQVRR